MIDLRSIPRLGIIIVTYQSAGHIAALWRSLAATIDSQRTSICVVDNGSTDRTVEILKEENSAPKLPLRLICGQSNLGFAKANNEAFDLLTAEESPDVVILLNPDTRVQPGWWNPLVEAVANPGVGAAAALLLLPDGKINSRGNALHFLGLGYVEGLGEEAETAKLDAPFFSGSGAALALRLEALGEVNRLFGTSGIFWEELFMYGEDSDLGWRLRLAGFETRLCPASRVIHDYRFHTPEDMAGEARLFWIERNRYLLLISNFKIPTLFLLLPWIVLSELALAGRLWKLYPRRIHLGRAVWKEIRSAAFWARRRRLQNGRKKTDREILRAMTGSIRHGARTGNLSDRLLDAGLRASHWVLRSVIWW